MGKFERKFSKYAIKNLSLVLVICYAIGYLISFIDRSGAIIDFISLNPYKILHGQVWRIFTWILMPPSGFDLFTLITLYFYFIIGKSLENTWGEFMYNVYIFLGMLFTVLSTFLIMGYLFLFPNELVNIYGLGEVMAAVARDCVSTYYVTMSIFLAFAATFPESSVLLMFIIPIKVKWLGVFYAAGLAYMAFVSSGYDRTIIVASLLNFVIFYFASRNRMKGTPIQRVKMAKRRHEFNNDMKKATEGISKHKCAICGRTELDSPDLSFRFCSKCNGNYEYCSEHLFTHTHVE